MRAVQCRNSPWWPIGSTVEQSLQAGPDDHARCGMHCHQDYPPTTPSSTKSSIRCDRRDADPEGLK